MYKIDKYKITTYTNDENHPKIDFINLSSSGDDKDNISTFKYLSISLGKYM